MKWNKGFTLIEMLVVIAIISIALVAVLIAINPLEQIRKARDAAKIKEAGDLLKAYGRYYATHKCYPWDPGAPNCTGQDDSRLNTATVPDFSDTGVDYDLIRQQYLKKSFAEKRAIQNGEYLVSVNVERRAAVCYEPESKRSRGGAFLPLMDNINQTPDADNACDNLGGYPDNSCFICVGF